MIKAIIVDDEKIARDNLKALLNEYCPTVKILGEANSVEKAIEIFTEQVDVIFLDINMPKKSGFELLNHLEGTNCEVVFITAYQEYALDAIKAGAFYYILKPIDELELISIIEKLEQKLKTPLSKFVELKDLKKLIHELVNVDKDIKIVIPVSNGFKIAKESDVLLIEGNNTKTKVHLNDGQIMDSTNRIRDFESVLSDSFFRVHKSYLVNLNHIKAYSSKGFNYVTLKNNLKVDVSRNKLDEFLKAINQIR